MSAILKSGKRVVFRILTTLVAVGLLAAGPVQAQAPARSASPVRVQPWTSPAPTAGGYYYSPGWVYGAVPRSPVSTPVYGYNSYTIGSAPTVAGYRYLDDYATGRHLPLAKPWAQPLR